MRQLSIRLAVSLAAFVVGVTLAWAFGAAFGRAVRREEVREIYVAPPAVKKRSCPTAPLAVEVPQPPPPPAVAEPRKRTRVVVRRPDGSVQVIETHGGPAAKE